MGSLLENERDCPYETFDYSVEPRPHQDNRLVLCAAREARPGANLRVALRRECVREDSV